MHNPDTPSIRVAVVGAGPAGFYAAGRLLAKLPDAHVDVFDRLTTPGGLVRAGVAPDHESIKDVFRVFEKIADRPGFRFFGGVEVGSSIALDDIRASYHAVMLTTGAPVPRALGIAGEDLPGSHPASHFVAWYNGHPDFADAEFDLTGPHAVVIGNGNVALDVARILVTPPHQLASTDIADHALRALQTSGINRVTVLGRRDGLNASFSDPELQQLARVDGTRLVADPTQIRVESVRDLLHAQTETTDDSRSVELRFLSTPEEVVGHGHVSGVRVRRNTLLVDESGHSTVVPTEDVELVEADLVLSAVGYRSLPVDQAPFDAARGLVPNEDGRVIDADGIVVGRLYTAGWARRGPSGVIGTNKQCAYGAADRLIEDHVAGLLPSPERSHEDLTRRLLALPSVVEWSGWTLIDATEKEAGAAQGRPRVKLVRDDELLAAARGER